MPTSPSVRTSNMDGPSKGPSKLSCPFVLQASVGDDDSHRGEEMRAAFKIFDKNRDGFITRSELKVRLGDSIIKHGMLDLIVFFPSLP